jgi:hypothetical protein
LPITQIELDKIYRFKDGTAWVYLNKDKEFLLIDKSGGRVPYETVIANEIHDGLLLCLHNNKYKFVVGESCLSGEPVEAFPSAYDVAQPFHNGLAEVHKEDKWGVIDTLGNEVVPIIYKEQSYIRSIDVTINGYRWDTAVHTYNRVGFGISRVEYKNRCGFLDKDGKPLVIKQ